MGMGIEPERIVISGFSQGGAMALAMLRSPHKFAAIIGACRRQTPPLYLSSAGMSCYLPKLSGEPSVSEANRKTPVFMCHGLYDPMIAFTYGKHSFEVTDDAGALLRAHLHGIFPRCSRKRWRACGLQSMRWRTRHVGKKCRTSRVFSNLSCRLRRTVDVAFLTLACLSWPASSLSHDDWE